MHTGKIKSDRLGLKAKYTRKGSLCPNPLASVKPGMGSTIVYRTMKIRVVAPFVRVLLISFFVIREKSGGGN